MMSGRWIAGLSLGALAAAGTMLAPALHAREGQALLGAQNSEIRILRDSGSFTPSNADPKLAAALANSRMGAREFRFTPSEITGGSSRVVAAAVRNPANRLSRDAERSAPSAPQAVRVAPIEYNLGTATGWKRSAAAAGESARIDLIPSAGIERNDASAAFRSALSAERASRSGNRTRVEGTAPKLVSDSATIPAPQMLDVGGSYSLTRNLDVTAGVRVDRDDRDRLPRLAEEGRKGDQAVYVGTAFRF